MTYEEIKDKVFGIGGEELVTIIMRGNSEEFIFAETTKMKNVSFDRQVLKIEGECISSRKPLIKVLGVQKHRLIK